MSPARLALALSVIFPSLACAGLPVEEAPVPSVPAPMIEVAAAPQPAPRQITFNRRPASAQDLAVLARLEAAWGFVTPSGDYWYDNVSGAAGQWGGPVRGFVGAAEASGGGSGMLTGVFINGREIHPLDVQGLTQLFGAPPWPGRWWVDGQGNFGPEGGPVMGNLMALVQQRRAASGGDSYYSKDPNNHSSAFVGSGCAAVTGRTRISDESSEYSYFVGCE
jgi:hypothetical protein